MIYAGCCLDPHASPPLTAPSLSVLAKLLSPRPIARTGGSLATWFPAPDKVDLQPLREFVDMVRRTGWRVLLDPYDLPPWATGGVPVAVAAVKGSSCQILAQWGVPRMMWPNLYAHMSNLGVTNDAHFVDIIATALIGFKSLTNTPASIAWHFVQNYRAEQTCSWAWNFPDASGGQSHGGVHVWGDPKFVEQDKLSAPRPALLSAATIPHADPNAVEWIAETLAAEFLPKVDFFGVGINEPDIALFNTLIAFDGVNGGKGGDTVRDRLIPERIMPFIRGIKNVLLGRGSLATHWPLIMGPNVAYPGTLPRFDPLFVDPVQCVDLPIVHAYGDESKPWPQRSYEHIAEYVAQMKASGDEWGISEVGGTDMAGWLRGLMALNLDPAPLFVINYDPNQLIEGFGQGGEQATADGAAFSAELMKANAKHHAAGGK